MYRNQCTIFRAGGRARYSARSKIVVSLVLCDLKLPGETDAIPDGRMMTCPDLEPTRAVRFRIKYDGVQQM